MRKHTNILIGLLLCLMSGISMAQEKILSKKKADIYFSIGIYHQALPTYLHLLEKNKSNLDLNFRIGVCYINSERKSTAKPYLDLAISQGFAPAYFYRGQVYHLEGNLDLAINDYLLFKRHASRTDYDEYDVDRYIEISQRAKRLMDNPIKVAIENLGDKINSPYADYVPIVSADESTLIFTSRRPGSVGGKKDVNGAYYEDIYFSQNSKNSWQMAENIGEAINTETHEACVGLSADGQKLLLYRMSNNGYGGDLYYSALEGVEWGKPTIIPGEINSPYWEPSACLSADEKMIIFSSNRPGGYGGRDLYVSRKTPDGSWGKPSNLGPIINTKYDEDAPFLHPDGRTLYFSSKGHNTMGGFDIFKSIMLEDAMWTLPQNIGYPINTVDDDIYFVLSTDGQRGYFSSDRNGGFGGKDIYVANMSEAIIPLKIIKGHVLDTKNEKPLKATITIIDVEKKDVQGIYRSNAESGKYLIILPSDKQFKIVIEAEEFYPFTEIFESSEDLDFQEILRDIYLETSK
jgi:tetratricopeptide (TPR) repeat protein